MDAVTVPLLLIAVLLALFVIRTRLGRRPLGAGGAEIEDKFGIVGPAALTFWVAFVLGAIPVAVISSVASPGGPEWGGPGLVAVEGIVIAALLGLVGGFWHGVAVYVLLRGYAAMGPRYRRGASAAAGIAVLLGLLALALLGVTDLIKGWPSLISTAVGLPFGLSILSIAAISRLPGARAVVSEQC